MELSDTADVFLYVFIAIVGTMVTAACVRLVWRARGMYRIRRAGPRHLRATHHVIWRDPGDVARSDMAGGPGGVDGAPAQPFRFVEEHLDRIATLRRGPRCARSAVAREMGR